MTGHEPPTTAVVRRECGCVLAAGDPAFIDDEDAVEIPTPEFRTLPWGCPKCDVGEAVKAERERCARIAAETTIGLTGFIESDRMEFCVANLRKLREKIAAAIREGRQP